MAYAYCGKPATGSPIKNRWMLLRTVSAKTTSSTESETGNDEENDGEEVVQFPPPQKVLHQCPTKRTSETPVIKKRSEGGAER